ncbi:hypothetical protein MBCUT_18550 [Methanobrevibacter cuticularis]|uniref:DUF1697 domain-containing protein n=1 Tax=Methanobrevibacter cuticularis TaxID=47311 RepID=A0A166CVE6_9EURY|nr:DUF1697 domain-containing protein [Methanobrevibacter cuticularis]KZX14902.1 hypothetical protein MBCUT_18550 [Methanobrevibacter cuticularis]
MKYACLLRGINVGKSNLIKMEELKELFLESGFNNPKTYLRSGNVIFESEKIDAKSIEKLIENNLKKDFGYDVYCIVKTQKDLINLIDNNPFKENPSKFLYFTLLSEKPKDSLIDEINNELSKYEGSNRENRLDDKFLIDSNEIYLLCDKYGRTKFNNNYFESKLNTVATTRNWNTVNKLIAMLNDC